MINDDGLGTAFGLCAFTGIINDEGIKMHAGAEDSFGETVFRQGNGFAGQPFHIAVLAHMNNRMTAKFKT